MDGTVLAYRILAHPHANEQPFTRSTVSVPLPLMDGATSTEVVVAARDSVLGFCGDNVTMEIPMGASTTIVATRAPTMSPIMIDSNITDDYVNKTTTNSIESPSWAPSLLSNGISNVPEPTVAPFTDNRSPILSIRQTPPQDECCHVIKLEAFPSFDDNENLSWRFSATMSSPYEQETGWDKYCDAFEIRTGISSEGEEEVVTTRILAHPHPNEQPFTRSSNGAVALPVGVNSIVAIARDSVSGYCGTGVTLELPTVDDGTALAEATSFVATQAPTPSSLPLETTAGPSDISVGDITTVSPTPIISVAFQSSSFALVSVISVLAMVGLVL